MRFRRRASVHQPFQAVSLDDLALESRPCKRCRRTMATNMADLLKQIPALVLSFEHFLGGQARITNRLTPSLNQRVMRKASGTAEALYPLIPIRDPVQNSQAIGSMMVLTGFLLAWKMTRGSYMTLGLNTCLTAMGIYSQQRMRVPYWLPALNLVLGLTVYWIENIA